MLIVHAHLSILPEKREEFLGGVGGLVEASNAEEGVLEYHLFEAVGSPNQFVMVERYADEAAFGGHLSSPHFGAAAQALAGWVSAPPKIIKY
ncbi:putative quinol monooxygenase, partial [Paraconexibacter sp.]|uniref:putative quinol monooxygenase n=1 Tax=Paraconexibacter sp. TaxID=2949640 RepID=UPI0035618E00